MSEIFFLKEKIHNVIKWDFSYGHLGKGGGLGGVDFRRGTFDKPVLYSIVLTTL